MIPSFLMCLSVLFCDTCERVFEVCYNEAYGLEKEIKYRQENPDEDMEEISYLKGKLMAYDHILFIIQNEHN